MRPPPMAAEVAGRYPPLAREGIAGGAAWEAWEETEETEVTVLVPVAERLDVPTSPLILGGMMVQGVVPQVHQEEFPAERSPATVRTAPPSSSPSSDAISGGGHMAEATLTIAIGTLVLSGIMCASCHFAGEEIEWGKNTIFCAVMMAILATVSR